MKDSYSFDIDDAGLQKSYDLHRDAYIKIFDRLGFDYVIVSAMSGAMGGSRQRGVPRDRRDRRGHLRPLARAGTQPTSRPSAPPVPDAGPLRRRAGRARRGHPRHPDHRRPWSPWPTSASRAPTGPGPRRTRSRTSSSMVTPARRHPRRRWSSGCPATARSTSSGSRPSWSRPRSSRSPRRTSPTTRRWSRATSGRRRSARSRPAASATSSTRASVTGTALGHRRQRAGPARLRPGRRPRLHPGRHDRGRRGPRRRPVTRTARGPLQLARGIEMGHIFQLGRKYAEALGLKVLDENGKLVTVTMGSYGVGVSRAVAAVAENTCDEQGSVLAARARAVRRARRRRRQGRDGRSSVADDLARQLDEAGVAVLLDDRKASPGVKFADAEIMGMPTIVVVGRGLADGVVEVRDRRSGERETCPPTTRWASRRRCARPVRRPRGPARRAAGGPLDDLDLRGPILAAGPGRVRGRLGGRRGRRGRARSSCPRC